MKKILQLIVTVATLFLTIGAARSATYTFGGNDLMLGFTSANKSTDVILDLGSPSSDTSLNPTGININLAASAFMTSEFGAGWYTNGSVNVGVFGNAADGGVWLNNTNTVATGRHLSESTIISTLASDIGAQYSFYGSAAATSTNIVVGGNTFGLVGYNNASMALVTTPWSQFEAAGWSGMLTGAEEVQLNTGATSLSVNYLNPSGAYTTLGTPLNFDGAGNLSIAAAVPEPSSAGLLGGGLLLAGIVIVRGIKNRSFSM